MTRSVFALAAVLAVAVPSRAADAPSLEAAASDVAATIQKAKRDAAAEPLVLREKAITGIVVWQDCQKFVFGENSPAVSDAKDFRSETWLEECDYIPLPTPPGGGQCIPRRRLLRADTRTVKVEVKGRSVPGPKEVFQVCLWESSLSLKVKESPFKYTVAEQQEPVFQSTLVLTRK